MFTPQEYHCLYNVLSKQREAAVGADAVVLKSALQKLKEECDANPLPKATIQPLVDLATITALIVDDDPSVIALVTETLGAIKVGAVLSASNGMEAIKIIQERKGNIDINLCDWFMPELNGFDMLQRIRKIDKLRTVPFIMVTAASDKEHIKKAIQTGVSDFIIKPIDIALLQEKFILALNKSKSH